MTRLGLAASFALVVGCGHAGPTDREVYVAIDPDAVATAQDVAATDHVAAELVARDDDRAILALPAGELDALSRQMHERFHRCGGFMAFDTLADALDARPTDGGETDYTIDHPGVVGAILPTLHADRIAATIRELSGMRTRYYRSETGAAASTWLRDRWRGYTRRGDVTVELVDHGYPQRSVVLTIPGTTRADEVVVLGGHLDSISMRGQGAAAPGADDDASGISTLDEVVRALLAADVRPARTIQVIAYAAEEVGLRGSLAIARGYRDRGVKVVGVLQLDMTNFRGSDKDIWLIGDHTDARQNAFLGQLIDRYVGASWGTTRCGYACSDHASWTRYGYPASMPFEARFTDANRRIHPADDTLARSNDNADHAAAFARLAAAYAIELAKAELPDGSRDDGDSSRTIWIGLFAVAAAAWLVRRRAR
jgi:leucyl aminopeptidase